MKVDDQDWHAVADAAMDLRELEAEHRIKQKYEDMRVMQESQHKSAQAMPRMQEQDNRSVDKEELKDAGYKTGDSPGSNWGSEKRDR